MRSVRDQLRNPRFEIVLTSNSKVSNKESDDFIGLATIGIAIATCVHLRQS